jgi:ribonucleoside-diphosphate reductase
MSKLYRIEENYLNHIELNNAITREKDGFYDLGKDQEALSAYLEEVAGKTQYFNNELDRLSWLVEHDFYFDCFSLYDEHFLKEISAKAYTYNFKFASYMAATKFYQSYALKTNDKKTFLENYEQHMVIVALYLAQGDNYFALELLDTLMKQVYQPATPTMLNAGRSRRGELVSCYLLSIDDSMNSINYNEGVARTLSKYGGGVALNLSRLRARGESIKEVEGCAKGVIPVAKSLEMSFQYADQLGQRPGAGAVYLNVFHADLPEFLDTKKVNADEGLRLATISTGLIIPDKFMELAKKNEPFYMFYPHNIHKHYGVHLDDMNMSEMYDTLVADTRIKKREGSARDILNQVAKMQLQSGYPYLMFKDNANKVHALKDIGDIHQSNLCVSGDTKILTKEYGYVDIETVSGQDLHVWNGQEWSKAPIRQTGENQELIRVTLSNGMHLDCTPYHKFYIYDTNENIIEVRAGELQPESRLIEFSLPNENDNIVIMNANTLPDGLLELQEKGVHSQIQDGRLAVKKAPIFVERIDTLRGRYDTYCFNESKRHMGMFNGILTGQCVEIMQLQEVSEIGNYGEEWDIKRDISCNLGSLNIANVMDDKNMYEAVFAAMKALTAVSNMSHIDNAPGVVKANDELHSVGLGVMNLHGYLAKNLIPYDSDEAKEFADVFFAAMNYYSILASMHIARKTKTKFKDFEKSEYAKGTYFDKYIEQDFLPKTPLVKALFEGMDLPTQENWATLARRVQKHGLYHAYRLAIAPTQSISYVQNATSSVMPIVDLIERRAYGDMETYYPMPFLDELTAAVYQTAYSIDQMKLIDLISVIQGHVDQGISTILYVNSTTSTRELARLYAYAHHKGLKSLYYTRNKLLSVEECTSCSI